MAAQRGCKYGRELAKRYPRVKVESDHLWVKDGNIYTSAGFSAGIDLALAWVEEDCDSALAKEAARELVRYLRRLSVSLGSQASEMKTMQELQIWIAEHLSRMLSVQGLADHIPCPSETSNVSSRARWEARLCSAFCRYGSKRRAGSSNGPRGAEADCL